MSLKSAILMTTYNGEKFISEQLKSIQRQTETNWQLYIRDDGSTDNTVPLIKEIASNDIRIKIISDENGNIGVKKGFMHLLCMVTAQFYFFADQDDIWFPEKMSVTIKSFKLHSERHPVLVHTNLTAVDEKLNILKKQVYPTSKRIDGLNVMLSSNSVTGCTVAINNALKKKISNDPTELMIMHDWWIGLCAVTFGYVEYIPRPMILYRQHEDNQVGTDTMMRDRLKKLLAYDSEKAKINRTFKQAKNLLKVHGSDMTAHGRKMVVEYAFLLHKTHLNRMLSILTFSYRKRSVMGTLSLWYAVMSQSTRSS